METNMASQPKQVASASAPAPVTPASVAAAAPSASTKASPATGVQQIDAAKNPSKVGNKVVLATGEARVDYIKRRRAEGASRGVIAKELGVAYQIVFAATKTKKEAAPVPAPAEAAK
jgi:hypothetical protein